MNGEQLRDGIYWVGAVDYHITNFHGYTTDKGSTYNAYLIIDEKIALVDNVKAPFAEELLCNIKNVVDPSKIDYIITNHVEPDHSGSLSAVMEACVNAVVVTTAQGKAAISKYYNGAGAYDYNIVGKGASLSLGKRTLAFVPVPMLHWPDSMVTYCPEEKILFSNDAFGQHFASSKRFDTENDLCEVYKQAAKYYANIVLPYGSQTAKALEVASSLDIEIIAPSHGLIWTKHIKDIIELYSRWCENETEERAVVIYDSMWNSTALLANAIVKGFMRAGVSVKPVDLKTKHISDILHEVLEAKYVCVGSPTLNNQMMPTVSAFLTYLKGLSPKGRKSIAFGSYGWSGQSVGQVEEVFKEMNAELLIPSVKCQYKPDCGFLSELERNVFDSIPAVEAQTKQQLSSSNALFNISYGLYVVSANQNGRDNACVTNTFLQVTSAEPFKCVITLSKRNLTHDMVMKTRRFNLSVLTEDAPFKLFEWFGFQSGHGADKFEGFDDFSRSGNGLVYLTKHANAFLSFDVKSDVDYGSHTMFTALLAESAVLDSARSVTYGYYQANIKPKPKPKTGEKQGFRCGVCGYFYEGETLPADFVCPLCKHGSADFTKE